VNGEYQKAKVMVWNKKLDSRLRGNDNVAQELIPNGMSWEEIRSTKLEIRNNGN